LSHRDAVKYRKIIYLLDGLKTTIIKVRIPDNLRGVSKPFEADGMDAILIEKENLNLLKVVY
jgi:hypothetical protein